METIPQSIDKAPVQKEQPPESWLFKKSRHPPGNHAVFVTI